MTFAWLALLLAWLIAAPSNAASAPPSASGPRRLGEHWTGDLDGMVERRRIRALVVYSKTFYFVDRGTQRGASYDALRAFEDDLNQRLRTSVQQRGDLVTRQSCGRGAADRPFSQGDPGCL